MTGKNRAVRQWSPASPSTSPPNAEATDAVTSTTHTEQAAAALGSDGAKGGIV